MDGRVIMHHHVYFFCDCSYKIQRVVHKMTLPFAARQGAVVRWLRQGEGGAGGDL
jgi:hypothetical protein